MRLKAAALTIALTILTALGCLPSSDLSAARRASQEPAPPLHVAGRIGRIETGLLPAISVQGKLAPMRLADRMAHYKVPGLSIAVINGGTLEWARGYGVAEAGTDQPVTIDTLFQAASISKPVAALGALYLVQRGQLSLDEDVNLKLKAWKVPDSEFTAQQKVTLRGLLSHSAGLTVHGFRGYAAGETVPTTVEILEGKQPANSAPIRADIAPGSRWRYSGGGFTVMQQLVTDVTGRRFHEFMREAVLDKIGMKHSTYEQPLPTGPWRAATGHRRDGQPVKGRWHTYPEMAAAGLWTTPSDLARFAIELQKSKAGQSNKVLSAEVTRQMLGRQLDNFGLGIGIGSNGAAFSHGGSNVGFRCFLFAYADTGQGVVIMTNGDNGSPLANELLRSVSREYGWPDFKTKELAVAAVDPKVYAAYQGEYETAGGKISVTSDGSRLFVQAPPLGPDKIELHPESETKYFITVEEIKFTFIKDDMGRVTELLIEPPGQPLRAKKVK